MKEMHHTDLYCDATAVDRENFSKNGVSPRNRTLSLIYLCSFM